MSIAVSVARSGFACWLQGPEIHGTFTDGRSFQTYSPSDASLIQRLYNKGVSIMARPQSDNLSWFVSPLISWLPFVALIGVCIFLSRQMQGIAKLLTEAHGRDERQNPMPEDRYTQDIKDPLAQTKSNLATLESGGLLQWADNTDAASAWFKRNIVMYEALLERFAKQSGRERAGASAASRRRGAPRNRTPASFRDAPGPALG
jgi:hypothetical protein